MQRQSRKVGTVKLDLDLDLRRDAPSTSLGGRRHLQLQASLSHFTCDTCRIDSLLLIALSYPIPNPTHPLRILHPTSLSRSLTCKQNTVLYKAPFPLLSFPTCNLQGHSLLPSPPFLPYPPTRLASLESNTEPAALSPTLMLCTVPRLPTAKGGTTSQGARPPTASVASLVRPLCTLR